MAATITIANSIAWAQTYGSYRSLTVGTANEPALTAANVVLQTILSAPFCWNWNRSSVSFLTTIGVQDYATASATFGTIEKASYVPAASITATSLTSNVATYTAANAFVAGNKVTVTGCTNSAVFNVIYQTIATASATQFTVAITNGNIGSAAEAAGIAVSGDKVELSSISNVLGADAALGQPNTLAPQIDDNAGNITFRIMPIPDATYQITVIFQKKIAALIAATATTWTPIPDHFSHIYQLGFLSLMMAYWNDPRYQIFNAKFVSALLGVAEGISEDQKNIFLAAWLQSMTQQQVTGFKAQQGTAAKGQ